MEENKKNNGQGRAKTSRPLFMRLFGLYNLRNEEQFHRFGKQLFFMLLVLVEVLVLIHRIGLFVNGGKLASLLASCAVTLTLTISMAAQLFFVKETAKSKTIFFVTDALASALFVFFAAGSYAVLVYALALTQFYIELRKPKQSFRLLLVSILFYMSVLGVQFWMNSGKIIVNIFELLEISFSSILTLVTHFVAVEIALAFYRQYFKLKRTLTELDKSKQELEKAYVELEEITALKERQRIAKDIHDTAGHSLTTVIMQTESAKRIIDNNPEEAKTKIVAANLQAKHALEELRNSVHLLSGVAEQMTLKSALLAIVHESMDGTGITIRSEIEDVLVNDEKYRFLCNALREGISNGIRHGGATAFWFELREEDGKINFLLSDNGKGVDGKVELGFGLRMMKEKVCSLGGELTIITGIEEGFEFHLDLPSDKE